MKHSERFVAIVNTAIQYCKWLILILVVLICCSGIRVINNYEVGVVLRFGRLVGDTQEEQIKQPGLLLAFPYVIDEVMGDRMHRTVISRGTVESIGDITHKSDTAIAYDTTIACGADSLGNSHYEYYSAPIAEGGES